MYVLEKAYPFFNYSKSLSKHSLVGYCLCFLSLRVRSSVLMNANNRGSPSRCHDLTGLWAVGALAAKLTIRPKAVGVVGDNEPLEVWGGRTCLLHSAEKTLANVTSRVKVMKVTETFWRRGPGRGQAW